MQVNGNTQNCGMCSFFSQRRCQRFPPTNAHSNMAVFNLAQVWPTVNDYDWCGEFKAGVAGYPSTSGDDHGTR